MIVKQNALVLRPKISKYKAAGMNFNIFYHKICNVEKLSFGLQFFFISNWVIPLFWMTIIWIWLMWQHLTSCSSARETIQLFCGPNGSMFFKCLTHSELWCDLLLRISWLALGLESRGIGWFTAENKNNTHIWWNDYLYHAKNQCNIYTVVRLKIFKSIIAAKYVALSCI